MSNSPGPTCEVALSLKEDGRKLELPLSTARTYLGGNNNDAIISPIKTAFNWRFNPCKKKNSNDLKKQLKISVLQNYFGD